MKFEIKKGEELSKSFIKFWDKTMHDKFLNDPIRNFEKNIFFILKDNKKIISLGMAIPIKFTYLNKKYSIYGIGEITSLIEKKGYGKILMDKIKNYFYEKRKTALGFCSKENAKFYIKCNWDIKRGFTKRFSYSGKTKKEEDYTKEFLKVNPIGIYIEGKDKFISKILSTKTKVKSPIQFW